MKTHLTLNVFAIVRKLPVFRGETSNKIALFDNVYLFMWLSPVSLLLTHVTQSGNLIYQVMLREVQVKLPVE
jgi:hypothetical protein